MTVFEKQDHAGGMTRYGIPEYRLPKTTLDEEIGVIQAMGVEIVTGHALGTHLRLEDLQRDFDSVYLAIGSWRASPLRVDGETPRRRLARHPLPGAGHQGRRGPARRRRRGPRRREHRDRLRPHRPAQGAKNVRLVYRRTREEMPAEPFEVEEALLEGIEMVFLTAPTRISAGDEGLQLHCLTMELGEPDRSGRRRPVAVEGSDFVIEADTIIGAIGQSTDTGFLFNDLPVRLNEWGDVDIDGHTMQTSERKIFSGGDCVTGPATVIQAVAAGRRAAHAMDEFVTRGVRAPQPGGLHLQPRVARGPASRGVRGPPPARPRHHARRSSPRSGPAASSRSSRA